MPERFAIKAAPSVRTRLVLFDGDVAFPNDPAPAGRFFSDPLGEFLRCAGRRVEAERLELLAHCGNADCPIGLGVQARHDGTWRARRSNEAYPRIRLEA